MTKNFFHGLLFVFFFDEFIVSVEKGIIVLTPKLENITS